MRTFAHKPRATQPATPAPWAAPGRASPGQGAEAAAILHLQRTIGNRAVQRLLHEPAHVIQHSQSKPALHGPTPSAIRRQPKPGPVQSGDAHTITDPQAIVRGGPPDFKPTGDKPLDVGARVDIIDTHSSKSGTFVNVVEHGSGTPLGWTSKSNLGDVQYAKAGANFVYVAKVKPRPGRPDTLPVMVYTPPGFAGKGTINAVLYFHGDAADYSASKSNNYSQESPAIGMDLPGVAAGADSIIIAPQVNTWPNKNDSMKSLYNTLHAGDYESIVQTVFTNLQQDLKLTAAMTRGAISIAGHSGGGKALGQAAQDLESSGGGVTDVTLVDAGYGGGENKAGKSDGGAFSQSFQMLREWFLDGKRGKVLRVITQQSSPGIGERHAIENNPDPEAKEGWRVPVLSVEGVRNAIKAKGLDGKLQADVTEVTDTTKRTGGMQLIRKIVVSHKAGGKDQGTIYVFVMSSPPRASGVDAHFGVRNATIGDIVSGRGKGDSFGANP